jgi:hypothetical protein
MSLAGELKSMVGVADSEFSKMFPSVLAVLDYWSRSREETLFVPNLPRLPAFTQSCRFQERGLSVELPLYRGELLMKVCSSDADTVRDPDFLEEINFDIKWGEPRVEPEVVSIANRLWEEQVPTFDF